MEGHDQEDGKAFCIVHPFQPWLVNIRTGTFSVHLYLLHLYLVESFAVYTHYVTLRDEGVGVYLVDDSEYLDTFLTFGQHGEHTALSLLYHPSPYNTVTPRSSSVLMASAIWSYLLEKMKNCTDCLMLFMK